MEKLRRRNDQLAAELERTRLVLERSRGKRALLEPAHLTLLRSPTYCDLAPAQVWARLLDDGVYLCSISTVYRLLAVAGETRERRRQRIYSRYVVGWTVAEAETGELAGAFLADCLTRQGITRGQLTLHADRARR